MSILETIRSFHDKVMKAGVVIGKKIPRPNSSQAQTHTPVKPQKKTPKASTLPSKTYGNIGRLEIPSLNISVPLYDTTTGTAQQIVDNRNSAVFLRWEKQKAIADHCDQANFSNLANAVVGKTTMSIEKPGSPALKYVCVKKQVGHIKTDASGVNHIFDSNWEPVKQQNDGGLCIYTCISRSADDVMDIRLTYWRPVAERI